MDTNMDLNARYMDTLDAYLQKKTNVHSHPMFGNRKLALIYANIQQGKTDVALAYAASNVHKLHRKVVFITRNITADAQQLHTRAHSFSTAMKQHMREVMGIPIDCGLTPMYTSDLSRRSPTEIETLVRNHNLFITLGNYMQIQTITNAMACESFVLILDEADSFGRDDSLFGLEYARLYETCTFCIAITASPLELIFQDSRLFNTGLIRVAVPEDYKGIQHLQFDTRLSNSTLPGRKTVAETDPNLIPTYLELAIMAPFALDQSTHPIICLHKTACEKKHQMDTMRLLKNNSTIASTFAIAVYNSDQIALYHKSLGGAQFIPGCKQTTIETNTIRIKCTISQLIQRLCDMDTTHIIIISGRLAGRSVSFVSTDFKYHLTHQYLISSATSDMAEVLQSLRILGRYRDDIPLTLYTSERNHADLIKTFNLQNRMIDTSLNTDADESMCELYTQIPVRKSEVPRRRLIKKAYELNVTHEQQILGSHYVIHMDGLSEVQHVYVSYVMQAMQDTPNAWIRRPEVITKAITIEHAHRGTSHSNEEYRATFSHIATSERTYTRTDDETIVGLIMKQTDDSFWHLRLNPQRQGLESR